MSGRLAAESGWEVLEVVTASYNGAAPKEYVLHVGFHQDRRKALRLAKRHQARSGRECVVRRYS